MPYVEIHDAAIYYEETGAGEPVVLVHGNWSDHTTWAAVVPELARSMRVVAYDRHGSGRSPRAPGLLLRRRHEEDLAALIEALELGPANVVANSYGASVALGLAARRPELFNSIVAHEPPLTSIVDGAPAAIARTEASLHAVLQRVEAGDLAGASEQFVEEVALGPGGWATLPEPIRAMMIANARAFADELRDPGAVAIDLAGLAELDVPVVLTHGDQSPAWFLEIVARLHESAGRARVVTLEGAAHNPHGTHPADFAAVVAAHVHTQKEAVR